MELSQYLGEGANKQGAVILTFDDGKSGVYNYALQACLLRGIKATAYINSDFVGDTGYMTLENLGVLDSNGWIVANHTPAHVDLGGQPQADQETQIAACADALDGWGFTSGFHHVAYPAGSFDANTLLAMAAQSMLTGRTTVEEDCELPLADYYQVPSRLVRSDTALATVQGYIDDAKANKKILTLYMHDVVASGATAYAINVSMLEDILDYIVAQQLVPITIDDFYNLVSGPVTITKPW